MKLKGSIFLLIGLFLITCQREKDSVIEDLALTLRYINKSKAEAYLVTVTGEAKLGGTIKGAKVELRTIPTSGSDLGKCNGTAGTLIASDTTTLGTDGKNNGGSFSIQFPKTIDKIACLVVTPTPTSTVYSPISKSALQWKSNLKNGVEGVRVVSIISLPEPTLQKSSSKKVNINPLTNLGGGAFTESIRRASGASGSLLSRAKGIIKGQLPLFAVMKEADLLKEIEKQNNKVGEQFFKNSKVKIDPTEYNFDDPTAPGYDPKLEKQLSSILGGMDKAVNKAITTKGGVASELLSDLFDKYLDGLTADFAGDGTLNGQGMVDEDGNSLTLAADTDFYNDLLNSATTLASYMRLYIEQEISIGGEDDGSGFFWDPNDINDTALTGDDICTAGYDTTGNCIGSFAGANEIPDGFPAPGNYGSITVTNNTTGTITLTWDAATDTTTASSSLQYQVYYSNEPFITDTLYTQEFGTPLNQFTTGLTTYEVTGLSPGYYFFNVLVRDAEVNTSAYTMEYGYYIGDGKGGVVANATNLDTSFGSGGTGYAVFDDGIGYESYAQDLVIDSNSSIWVTGGYHDGTYSYVSLWKYDWNGIEDTTFGTNGLLYYSGSTSDPLGFGLDFDPSGNIYIVGNSTSGIGLSVYTWDGSSFTELNNPNAYVPAPRSIFYDGSSNSLFVSASCNGTGSTLANDICILKLNPATNPVTLTYGNTPTGVFSVYESSGGGIAMYGGNLFVSVHGDNGSSIWDTGVLRVNPLDGTIAPTGFGSVPNSGSAIYTNATSSDIANSIAVDSVGKIYLLSVPIPPAGPLAAPSLVRFDSTGNLDITFGFGGVYTFGPGEMVNDIKVDANNRPIVVGGTNDDLYSSQMKIWRFNTDGTLDTSFNSVGYATNVPTGGKSSIAYSVKPVSGKIVIAGISLDSSSLQHMTLWRLNP